MKYKGSGGGGELEKMNDYVGALLFLFVHLILFPNPSVCHPLCTNSRQPFTLKGPPLAFCPYNGTVCCDSAEDSQLLKQFQGLNVPDAACASLLKSILCAKCDQFSAELFKAESGLQTVPVLCNSTISVISNQYSNAANDFCTKVWDTCQNVSIWNSPFTPSLKGGAGLPINSTVSKITDFFQSKTVFCKAFGGSSGNGSTCFNGQPTQLNNTETFDPPKGLCIEKIGNGSYLNMVPHPDGSNRAFFSNQKGQIWMAMIPEQGSGATLNIDEAKPFLDISDEVHFDTEFGLMGLAFHPNFARNGRFFVSYNCDKVDSPRCSGRCSCNSNAGCDPSKLGLDNGAQPCRYHSIIAEFTANGTGSEPSSATIAHPSEVRRIFTMGLPFTGHHAGQILFGPSDGYMYFMMGDGGNRGDPFNFSQNKKSLLGKIMRFNIDDLPSANEISDLGRWGNYSVPGDNPFADDEELEPEIWAMGFRNPWRCSFDSERPSYFLCADVGQEQYEEVDMITKGGNYGWRVYEGYSLYHPLASPGGTTSASSINPIFPVMGYNHSEVNKNEGSASITGGYFYRSSTDPCMYGRYLFADLFSAGLWAGTETPENSGNFTSTRIPFNCAGDSPMQCDSVQNSPLPVLGYIFSFGQDNRRDTFILASSGVYRVVRPHRCNYTCSNDNTSVLRSPGPNSSSSPSSGNGLSALQKDLVLLLSSAFFLLHCFVA